MNIIFGAGPHARVIASLLKTLASGATLKTLFVDQKDEDATLRDVDLLRRSAVYLGIGDDNARRAIFTKLADRGIAPRTCIGPSTFVSPDAEVGPGCVICPGAIIMPNARIGANVIVNTNASVDHDCVVGDHSQLCPGVTLAGLVTVGEQVFIGTRAAVIPKIKIGAGAKIRAGAVVWRDVPPRVLVGGNPAEIVRNL